MSPFIEQLTINDPVLLPLALSPLGLGDPSTRRYRTIKTLTLHWQDEALDHCAYGPAREARMLAKTFAEWGWQTEDYIIPVNNPAESIREFLKSKTDDSGGDELLIVYYVGHGFKSHQGPLSRPFAVGTQGHSSTDPVVLEWPVIRSVLEAAQSDVVMFLNCCHAADSWVSRNLEHDEYIGPTGKVMVCPP
ncbi:hypothetical protein GGR52DRAFT_562502 [Hypoxylon sp. FL1284]|nr:hypothetical protein GGR52DRAFT_562502 [Hypoxylon sp. FL1284]